MNAQQKYLVQSSFEKVAPIAETAAALFLWPLVRADRSLRPMFQADMKEQGRKLMPYRPIGNKSTGRTVFTRSR